MVTENIGWRTHIDPVMPAVGTDTAYERDGTGVEIARYRPGRYRELVELVQRMPEGTTIHVELPYIPGMMPDPKRFEGIAGTDAKIIIPNVCANPPIAYISKN